MVEQPAIVDGDARPFEWWMTSNLALGLAFNCFLPVLLPSYVLSAGGTATDVWVTMSMAGLFALLGPSIGRLAGRHRAHRLVQVLGLLGMAVGLVALALSHGDSLSIVLAIAVMGIGAAAVAVVAPMFILASILPTDFQARQLTWLQLNLDLGKIMGGLLLGAMATEKLSFPAQFLFGGLGLGLLGVLVWTTSRGAARRIRQPEMDHTAPSELSRTVVPWRTLLLSLFGVPVVAQLLSTMTMLEAQTSTILTVSGLAGIGLYFLAGRWMTRSNPGLVWATAHVVRGAGGVILGVLSLTRGMPYLVVLAAFLVLESTPAIAWLLQTRAAAQVALQATAAVTGAVRASRHIVPAGQLDQRASRHAESVSVLVSASPSPVLSQHA
ncbi:MAG: MFS transporter [Pseudonocardiales bacterium]|nr:MFS transporter [Pseudonocardiales bacterium]